MSKLELLLKDGKWVKNPTKLFELNYEQFKEELGAAKEWLWVVNEKNINESSND